MISAPSYIDLKSAALILVAFFVVIKPVLVTTVISNPIVIIRIGIIWP